MGKKIFVSLLILSLLLCGCKRTVAPPSSSAPETKSQVVSSESKKNKNFNPLTGEYNLKDSAVGKRPYSVMVSNIKKALPQYGLSSADLCYEVLAEGGITRIMALFSDYQNVPMTGPVRSVRDYYTDLSAPHNTLFIHFGGSPKGYAAISQRGINNLDGMVFSTTAFIQDKQLAATKGREHSFFITSKSIQYALNSKGYSVNAKIPSAFKFSSPDKSAAMNNAASATYVNVPYSNYCQAMFEYNAKTKQYLKGEFGQKHIDANNGKQISVKNVLVIYTSCVQIAGDKSGRIAVSLNSGNGDYISNGKKVDINWSKGNYQNKLKIMDKQGKELTLNAGKTWVSIVPIGANVRFE